MKNPNPLPVRWSLARYLERVRVTPHALMRETGLSSNTVYPIVRGEAKAVNLETLGTLAAGIESLTGHRPELTDLLEIADPVKTEPNTKLAALLKNAKPFRWGEVERFTENFKPAELERERQIEAEERTRRPEMLGRQQKKSRQLLKVLGGDDE